MDGQAQADDEQHEERKVVHLDDLALLLKLDRSRVEQHRFWTPWGLGQSKKKERNLTSSFRLERRFTRQVVRFLVSCTRAELNQARMLALRIRLTKACFWLHLWRLRQRDFDYFLC